LPINIQYWDFCHLYCGSVLWLWRWNPLWISWYTN